MATVLKSLALLRSPRIRNLGARLVFSGFEHQLTTFLSLHDVSLPTYGGSGGWGELGRGNDALDYGFSRIGYHKMDLSRFLL